MKLEIWLWLQIWYNVFMKEYFKKLIVAVLSFESKKVLEKFNPKIIGITGNIGKTTTKDYVYTVLKSKYGEDVLASKKSFNSEFGTTLTILNQENPWNNPFLWLKVITLGFLKTYLSKKYAEILVLEVGADKKGDIEHVTTFVKPDLVVLTAFQDKPTHGDFFKNLEEHVREKQYLVDALKDGGIVIYNNDDKILKNLVKSEHNSFSYGKRAGSSIEILGTHNFYEESKIAGIKVILKRGMEVFEIVLEGVIGEAHSYSIAAAVLVGILENMEKSEIEKSFESVEQPKSRMRILQGVNNSTIIDDTYNASPDAVKNALHSLQNIETTGKKIVVLGHMAELKDAETAHIEIGNMASKVADVVILSGKYNNFYLRGLEENSFPLENVRFAQNPKEVLEIVSETNLIQENDIILLKGSQSARLEKVVVGILLDKKNRELVCRQDEEWNKR